MFDSSLWQPLLLLVNWCSYPSQLSLATDTEQLPYFVWLFSDLVDIIVIYNICFTSDSKTFLKEREGKHAHAG